jgi:copper(I)-binding protein
VRALPPSQSRTAGYLTAVNRGAESLRIVGARAQGAGRVEIHRTREVDGLMRMEPLPALVLAPGERLELAPGGIHLMLLELQAMPAAGESLQLCLEIEGGSESCARAAVRREAPGEHSAHDHH